MERSSNEVSNPVAGNFVFPSNATFGMGDRVRKKSGAAWQGQIVGWYCTNLTPKATPSSLRLTQAQYRFILLRRLNASTEFKVEVRRSTVKPGITDYSPTCRSSGRLRRPLS